MSFQFTFQFDSDKIGTKEYTGTITQCVRAFNADCKTNVLPQVESLISIKNLQHINEKL